MCINSITSISLVTLSQSLDLQDCLSSDITKASVSDNKQLRSFFNAGHFSRILRSGVAIVYLRIKFQHELKKYKIRFYDHAIESGWYHLIIKARYFTGGMSTGVADYDFDPPGGAGGGDPLAII